MRKILVIALFAAVFGLNGNDVRAQTIGVQSKPAATRAAAGSAAAGSAVAGSATASSAAAEIAARPDAFRYYWHNSEWWYFTPQNTWLRWNGSTWIAHHSINDSGAFAPAPAQVVQPTPDDGSVTPGGTSYRYEINRRKGGL